MQAIFPSECLSLGLPMGGKWYYQQQPIIDLFLKNDKKGYVVAWDRDGENGSKIYGYYKKIDDYYEALTISPPREICGYELIVEENKCRLYMDIEWKSEFKDEKHQVLGEICDKLTEFGISLINDEMDFNISCGSRRVSDGKYKNSYHIVAQNVFFANNHDGMMKKCVCDFMRYSEGHVEWTVNGECIMDLRVYNRNRCFRTLQSSKKGNSNPLQFFDLSSFTLLDQHAHTFEHFKKMSVYVTEDTEAHEIFYNNVIEEASQPPCKKQKALPQPQSTVDNPLPFPIVVVKDALIHHGDRVTSLTKVVCHYDSYRGEPYWKIQGCSGKQERICLSNRRVVHRNNNCLVFVYPSGIENFLVQYRCMGGRCKPKCLGVHSNLTLGHICYNPDKQRWCFEMVEPESEMEDLSQSQELDCCSDIYSPACCSVVSNNSFSRENSIASGVAFSRADSIHSLSKAASVSSLPRMGEMSLVSRNGSPSASHASSLSRGFRQVPVARAVSPTQSSVMEDNRPGGSEELIPSENTYEIVKAEQELNLFKMMRPFSYIYLHPKKEYQMFSPEKIKHFLANVWCFVEHFSNEGEQIWKKKRFVDLWVADPDIRTYEEFVLDPTKSSPDCYNIWKGWRCEDLEDVTDVDPAVAAEPIVQHILKVICNDRQNDTDFLLDWMAHIVQRPQTKTCVAILLFGVQGCGKGIIFEWFREKVLGDAHSYQTGDPLRDLFGKHSLGLLGKVFVQVDETGSLFAIHDKLKNTITNKTMTFEEKNKSGFTTINLVNLLFTSNNERVFNVDTNDRRLVMFECNSKYKNNLEYFQGLNRHLKTEGVDLAFYRYLKSRQLPPEEELNFQSIRPITSLFTENQKACVNAEARYLSAYVNKQSIPGSEDYNDIIIQIQASHFYQRFRAWAEVEGLTYRIRNSHFATVVQKYEGVTKPPRTSMRRTYTLDTKILRQDLIRRNEYVDDAILHDWAPREWNARTRDGATEWERNEYDKGIVEQRGF